MCAVCLQYHQLNDEYFTGAVLLSLVLTALIGILYLLIMPQYVQPSVTPSHRILIQHTDTLSGTPPSIVNRLGHSSESKSQQMINENSKQNLNRTHVTHMRCHSRECSVSDVNTAVFYVFIIILWWEQKKMMHDANSKLREEKVRIAKYKRIILGEKGVVVR